MDLTRVDEERLLELEARYCSFGDTVHYSDPPRIFARSDGLYVYDETEVPYLDMQSAYGSANFGHANPFFVGELTDQLTKLPHLASEYITREKILLSQAICESVTRLTHVEGRAHFNVGGSQAVDDALKIIATDRGHRRVFAFEGSYHGRTLGASALTSSYRYRRRYGAFGERAHFIPFPYCFRCPYEMQRADCELYCVRQVERLFDSEYQAVVDPRTGDTEFAAFFIETIQGTAGYIIPPDDYFPALQRIIREHDILMVIDDIQMGFYRTGSLWSMEHYDLCPDILVFGKSLTNGMNPLAGIWATEALIGPERFPPGSTHSTFSNNPQGMRLGLATFKWMAEHDYRSKVRDLGGYLVEGLRELQKRFPQLGDVDGKGLAVRVEICEADGYTPSRRLTDLIKARSLSTSVTTAAGDCRLLLDVGGHYKNVFTLAPPLDIGRAELDMFLAIFEDHLVAAIEGST